MPGPNDLLSVGEVAEMKQVPPDTVRRRILRNKLPAIKKSDVWLVKRRDAEAWEVQRKRNGLDNLTPSTA